MKENAESTPGISHRKGISLISLFEMIPDNEAAEKWFDT